MSYLNLAEDGRILCAQMMPETKIAVDTLPDGDITDYRYLNGKFVLDPLPVEPEPEPEPTEADKLAAQVAFTAMMTDTLLEEGAADV